MEKRTIRKIENSKKVYVSAQNNCTVSGKPYYYVKGEDCLNDCTAVNKPRYFYSMHY